MKTIPLLVLVILFLAMDVSGQGGVLILTKKKNNTEKHIREGKRIKVVTEAGNMFRGNFSIISDSCIAIDSDTIRLSEIERIRFKASANLISGGAITGVGVLGTVLGVNLMLETIPAGGYAALFGIIFGLPIATVGVLTTAAGVIVIVSGKKYTNVKWQYRIQSSP
jgi:hypothetical protein